MGGIYKYQNKIDGKIYIGQTINFKNRFNAHKNSFYNKNNSEYYTEFSKAVRKDGEENFSYEILAKDIEDKELLNLLEQYYISFYESLYPNGYNKSIGGNFKPEWTKESRENFSFVKGKLTLQEVQELRKSYLNNESPQKIYDDKYSSRLTWGGFINIWRGVRYSHVMPEVFEKRRTRYKLNKEQVLEIREKYKNDSVTYQDLAETYGVCKNTIKDIITYKTWKNI